MPSAFLFPGQGAQFVGMGRSVIERCPAAARYFDIARATLGYDLAEICFEGPLETLSKTAHSQPGLYVCSFAALELLKTENPAAIDGCRYAAGLSLGEYTALAFAGAMTFEEGLRVVQVRGEAMQAAAEAAPSGMVSALMLDAPAVAGVVEKCQSAGRLWIANYLCPGNTVLSGDTSACDEAVRQIEAAGGKPVPLTVAGAFHTPLMEPACERLAAALNDVQLQTPRIPVVSNVDARTHSDPDEIRQLLIQQVVHPVRWEDSMRWLLDNGVDGCFEVGPGKVLKGLLKRIDRKLECASVGES